MNARHVNRNLPSSLYSAVEIGKSKGQITLGGGGGGGGGNCNVKNNSFQLLKDYSTLHNRTICRLFPVRSWPELVVIYYVLRCAIERQL